MSTPPLDAVPELDPGLTILHQNSRHATAFHHLALAELQRRDGRAYWLDARNNASTYLLYDLVDHPRQLRHLRIARAFTAYQYFASVRTLVKKMTPTTTFVCSPVPADLFRDDDIPEPEDHTFLAAAIRNLAELASVHDVPILVSASSQDRLGSIVTDAADHRLKRPLHHQGANA